MKRIIVLAIAVLLLAVTSAQAKNIIYTGPVDARTHLEEAPTITPTDHRGTVKIIDFPDPTMTPTDHRGTVKIIDFPDPTSTPVHQKNNAPAVYATSAPMTDAQFQAHVIELLEQILVEVKK
jgi:hypothetical protein